MSGIQQCATAVAEVFPDILITTPQGQRLPLRRVMVAVAGVETGWDIQRPGDRVGSCSTCHYPDCDGWTSFGWWQEHLPSWAPYLRQITGSDRPCVWAQWLKTPHGSAQAAWHSYQTAQREFGHGLQPWWPDVAGPYGTPLRVTNPHPKYLDHLSAAQQALAEAAAPTLSSSQHTTSPNPGVPGPTVREPTRPSNGVVAAGLVLSLMGIGTIAGAEWDWHHRVLREAERHLGLRPRL